MLIILLLSPIAATVHAEYYLQFGSFKIRNGAEKVVRDLAARNIAAVIVVHESADPSQGPWHKVRSVLSPDLEELLHQKRALEESGPFHGIMVVDAKPHRAMLADRKVHEPPPAHSSTLSHPARQVESNSAARVVLEGAPAGEALRLETVPSPPPERVSHPLEDLRRKIDIEPDKLSEPSGPAKRERQSARVDPAKRPMVAGPIIPSEPSRPSMEESRNDRLGLLKPQLAMASLMPQESSEPFREENRISQTSLVRQPIVKVPNQPAEVSRTLKVEAIEPRLTEEKQMTQVAASRPVESSPPQKMESVMAANRDERLTSQQPQSGELEADSASPPQPENARVEKKAIQKQSPQKPAALQPAPVKASLLWRKQAGHDKRDITLKWDAIVDPDVAGYKIYYDTNQGPVWDPNPEDCAAEGRPPVIVQKGTTEFTLHGLKSSKDYFFSITAYKRGSNVEIAYANGMIAPAVEIDAVRSAAEPGRTEEPRDKGPAPDQTDLIAAGDVLDIFIPGQKEMSRIYDVDPDGNIYLLLTGRMKARGVNAGELETLLGESLRNFIGKGDRITVRLLSRERYIQIQTGVRYPGWYRVPQRSKLDDLIEMAGGPPVGADPSNTVLRRKTGGRIQEMKVKGEISLNPDDVVVVPFPKGFDERIDAGDLIFVSIPEKEPPVRSQNIASYRIAEESKQNRIEVDRRGYLHVPQVGEFLINNFTPKDVTQLIKDRLPKYLAHESAVEVNIVEKRHPVQVLGHVANPGWHNVGEERNVQEVIAAAGGAVDGAVMSEISIQREWGGLSRNIRVNVYQFSITGDPRIFTPIHSNDIVFVPISSSFGDIKRSLDTWHPPPERLEDDVKKKFKIFGAVHHPGVYEPKEEMNLLDAIVTAGGETHLADMSRILIVRQNRVEVKFNLEDYLSGKAGARLPKILRGDTIYVSPTPLTYFEPKEDQVFYILGEVKRPTPPDPVQGYKLKDDMTVIQAISLAGGPTEWAKVERISIIRHVAGKQENIPYNLKRAIAGKYPEVNIYVRPNDVIFVP